MSGAHTVGEWTKPGLSRLERVRAYRAEFGGDISAAVAAADAEIYRQERDGRLRLAEAAPDLLDALKAAESLLSGWCERIAEGRTSWDDWDEFYKTAHYGPTKYRPDAGLNERLRAVIAKATTAAEPNSVGTPQGVNQND